MRLFGEFGGRRARIGAEMRTTGDRGGALRRGLFENRIVLRLRFQLKHRREGRVVPLTWVDAG